MKKKILLWLIKHMSFDHFTERELMFKLQCREQADKAWEEVKEMRAESGCTTYAKYLDWRFDEFKRL